MPSTELMMALPEEQTCDEVPHDWQTERPDMHAGAAQRRLCMRLIAGCAADLHFAPCAGAAEFAGGRLDPVFCRQAPVSAFPMAVGQARLALGRLT